MDETPKTKKWLKNIEAGEPIGSVARAAIRDRLDAVLGYLQLVSNDDEQDIEYVHQLRVSTRRASAAIKVFSEQLPPKKSKRLGKKLSRLRRSSSEVRELDVFEERHKSILPDNTAENLMAVWIQKRKKATRAPLVKYCRNLIKNKIDRDMTEIIQGARWRGHAAEPTFETVASEKVQVPFRQFVDGFSLDFRDTQQLHKLRVRGKKLRYTLELLSRGLPSHFRKTVYPFVEEIQTRLGTLNDHASAIEMLSRWLPKVPSKKLKVTIQQMLEAEQRSTEKVRKTFLHWWTPTVQQQFVSRFSTNDGLELNQ